MPAPHHLLEVNDLTVNFFKNHPAHSGRLEARAVDGVSFKLDSGKTVALVGESGCGKTMIAFALMGLVPEPGKISRGAVRLEGVDLLALNQRELRKYRGNELAMIFQEPMTALNPVLSIGDQIEEAVLAHRKIPGAELKPLVIKLLRQVGIPSPEERYGDYPHQLSGGMRQRVLIAMALINRPKLIIADEPTTALDVTIQRQILDLLTELARESGTATLLITHDLGVVRETADEVIVMYAGKIMEQAATSQLFANPLHPYTQGLMASTPSMPATERDGRNGRDGRDTTADQYGGKANAPQNAETRKRLKTIPGTVPSLWNKPNGCLFNTRCPYAFEQCFAEMPPLAPSAASARKSAQTMARSHLTRCWLNAEAD